MRISFFKTTLSLAILVLTIGMALGQSDDARLLRYPDISQDRIVFVYAGNLWTVGLEGGLARKLTSDAGMELFPKFSPDGRWIAFSGQYDGNTDVFVIPAEGGQPKRLTWHPLPDRVVDWFPGGDKILTLSRSASWKERFERYFAVPVAGGQPEMLSVPEGGPASFSPEGTKIAYNRISIELRSWKRYRGGMTPDIWIYDLSGNKAEKIIAGGAIDNFPMWAKDKIYFLSDRERTANIFCYDLKTRKTEKLTNHDEYDVQWPSLGGDRIVYMNGGWLWVLDLKSRQTKKLSITVPDDGVFCRPRTISVENYIQSGGISPSGKRVVIAARGDIFTLPAEKGNGRNLTLSPGSREKDPAWSPDGQWIAYYSDKTGEYEIYLRRSDGQGEEVQVTRDGDCYRHPLKWSPDSKKLVYSDSRMTFHYLDIDKKTPVRIDRDEYGHTPTDYSWSGDSRWIAYSKTTPGAGSAIYLYSLKDAKSTRLGSGETYDGNPVFDRDGKVLYFASQRNLSPTFSDFDNSFVHTKTICLFAAPLQKDGPSPLAPESDEEAIKDEKKAETGEKPPADTGKAPSSAEALKTAEAGSEKKEPPKPEVKEWKIDLEGLAERAVCLPIPAGIYGNLSAGNGALFFTAAVDSPAGDEGQPSLRNLMVYDPQKRETKDVLAGIAFFDLSADGKKIACFTPPSTLCIIDAAPGQKPGTGKVSLADLRMKVDYLAEWKQIFNEAWRQERDFFYDPNLHGVDWKKMKTRYEQLLPYCAHRDDLNYILSELQGELNCSHAYVSGGDYPRPARVQTGLLGADIDVDREAKLYRVGRIFAGENWESDSVSPLAQPGLKIQKGNYILAVNGRPVNWPESFYRCFEDQVGKQVKLTVNDKPTREGSWDIVVTPIADEQKLRYLDQVEANRVYVDKASGGKVGYVHVPDTAGDGLKELFKELLKQPGKEGFIVDDRYNNGGQDPNRMIELLNRPLISYWGTQQSQSATTPSRPMPPHLACLINAYAGSGGDAFPHYFRQAGLGPLIGTRTWGGLVGYSRNMPFSDNGGITMPDVGVYSPAGKWIIENHGVDPDIEIDNLPDQLAAGHDAQLDKAIEVVMAKIKANPVRIPPKPAYPVRN